MTIEVSVIMWVYGILGVLYGFVMFREYCKEDYIKFLPYPFVFFIVGMVSVVFFGIVWFPWLLYKGWQADRRFHEKAMRSSARG